MPDMTSCLSAIVQPNAPPRRSSKGRGAEPPPPARRGGTRKVGRGPCRAAPLAGITHGMETRVIRGLRLEDRAGASGGLQPLSPFCEAAPRTVGAGK